MNHHEMEECTMEWKLTFFFFFLLNPVHHDVYFIISIFELIDMYTKYFKQKKQNNRNNKTIIKKK